MNCDLCFLRCVLPFMLLAAACGESVAPPPAALSAIWIETQTTGDSLDDGYTISLDNVALPSPILPNDRRLIGELPMGEHIVTLNGVDGQCFARRGTGFTRLTTPEMDTLRFLFWMTCARTLARVDERIILETDRNAAIDVYAVRPDGTDAVNLTNNGWNNRRPAISPDGLRITFSRSEGSYDPGCPSHEMGICWGVSTETFFPYVMNVDRTGLRPLTSDVPAGAPVWSPDGTRLALVTTSGLMVINADGSGERTLRAPRRLWSPRWAPDGRSIAVLAANDSGSSAQTGLYVLTLDSVVTRVIARPVSAFDWSPDGTQFAFMAIAHSPTDTNYTYSAVFVVNADGSGERELAKMGLGGLHQLRWSPDGSRIASLSLFDDVRVISADGRGEARLAPGKQVAAFAWSPDGTRLALEIHLNGMPKIHTINVNGSGLRNLTAPLFRERLAMWSRQP